MLNSLIQQLIQQGILAPTSSYPPLMVPPPIIPQNIPSYQPQIVPPLHQPQLPPPIIPQNIPPSFQTQFVPPSVQPQVRVYQPQVRTQQVRAYQPQVRTQQPQVRGPTLVRQQQPQANTTRSGRVIKRPPRYSPSTQPSPPTQRVVKKRPRSALEKQKDAERPKKRRKVAKKYPTVKLRRPREDNFCKILKIFKEKRIWISTSDMFILHTEQYEGKLDKRTVTSLIGKIYKQGYLNRKRVNPKRKVYYYITKDVKNTDNVKFCDDDVLYGDGKITPSLMSEVEKCGVKNLNSIEGDVDELSEYNIQF